MFGELAGGPSHAVFGVELGRQCPSRQALVHAILSEPRGELAVAVEPVSAPRMADDVVHRTKPVVCATDDGVQEWMASITVVLRWPDLEHPMRPDMF